MLKGFGVRLCIPKVVKHDRFPVYEKVQDNKRKLLELVVNRNAENCISEMKRLILIENEFYQISKL